MMILTFPRIILGKSFLSHVPKQKKTEWAIYRCYKPWANLFKMGDFSRAVEKNRSAIAWWYCSCTSPAPSCGWGLQETPARLHRSGSFPARSGWVDRKKNAAWYAAWTRSINDMIYHWYIIDISLISVDDISLIYLWYLLMIYHWYIIDICWWYIIDISLISVDDISLIYHWYLLMIYHWYIFDICWWYIIDICWWYIIHISLISVDDISLIYLWYLLMIYHWYIFDICWWYIIDISLISVDDISLIYHWYLFLRSLRTSTGHPKFYPSLAARIFCRRFFHPTAKQNAQGGCQHPKLRLRIRCMKWFSWNIMTGGWFSNQESRLTKLSVCISIYAYNVKWFALKRGDRKVASVRS